jgi:hypothetical protein
LDYLERIRQENLEQIKKFLQSVNGQHVAARPESCLVESLWFTGMTDRHRNILKMHANTYEWMLSRDNPSWDRWNNFVEWLEKEAGFTGSAAGLALENRP